MSRDTSVTTAPADATQIAEERRTDARRERHAARAVLWSESILKRVRYCGRYATGDSVAIRATVSGATARAGLGGVQTCGSVWACPVCSEKVNAERRNELENGIRAWIADGGSVLLLTLTMSHRRGQHLHDLWDALSPAWNGVTSGAGWKADRLRFGIEGFVRVVETKHGQNGWHPHVHALLFLRDEPTPGQAWDLKHRLFGRWEHRLGKAGLRTAPRYGVDLRKVNDASEVADYLTKNQYETSAGGAAFEVTGSYAKAEGKGGRTPFQLLAEFAATGDLDLLNLWHEYEAASRGRRQLTWSQGLRDTLRLAAERTDQEIAEDGQGGDTLARIDAQDFKRLAAWGLVPAMLEAAEQDQSVLLDWLRHVAGVEPLHGAFLESQGRIYREPPTLFATG